MRIEGIAAVVSGGSTVLRGATLNALALHPRVTTIVLVLHILFSFADGQCFSDATVGRFASVEKHKKTKYKRELTFDMEIAPSFLAGSLGPYLPGSFEGWWQKESCCGVMMPRWIGCLTLPRLD